MSQIGSLLDEVQLAESLGKTGAISSEVSVLWGPSCKYKDLKDQPMCFENTETKFNKFTDKYGKTKWGLKKKKKKKKKPFQINNHQFRD